MLSAQRFYSRSSLQVETYDLMSADVPGGDDIAFFCALARESGGAVLELGCGSGRVTIPVAAAGNSVVGMDRSLAMLNRAEEKRRALPEETQARLELLAADMTTFDLGRTFSLIFAAYRVFMSLTDPAAQRAALSRIRRHLAPGGTLVIDVFDPVLERFTPERRPGYTTDMLHPMTGNVVRVSSAGRVNDPLRQVLEEEVTYRELDADGRVLREDLETLTLRWTYRQELYHLLELEGFTVTKELSDYAGSPPRYGGEIIVLARRR